MKKEKTHTNKEKRINTRRKIKTRVKIKPKKGNENELEVYCDVGKELSVHIIKSQMLLS